MLFTSARPHGPSQPAANINNEREIWSSLSWSTRSFTSTASVALARSAIAQLLAISPFKLPAANLFDYEQQPTGFLLFLFIY